MATVVSPFGHSPIANGSRQIRLFKLLPELKAGLIQCEIAHFDLSAELHYRALSYEWGPPEPTRLILINGSLLTIRENLRLFLDVLRHEVTESCIFWADQICIDQSNLIERNHQVQLMSEIYSNASQVVAWLGYSRASLTDIMAAIEKHPCCALGHSDIEREQHFGQPLCNLSTCVACSHIHDPMNSRDLVKASYWTRVWIIQELALAKRIVFFLGSERLSVDILESYCKILLNRGSNGYLSQASIIRILSILQRPESRLVSLDTCIERYVSIDAYCADPRDRLYALQGLVKPEQRLNVDYRLPANEVLGQLLERALFDVDFCASRVLSRQFCTKLDILIQYLGLPPCWYHRLALPLIFSFEDMYQRIDEFVKVLSYLRRGGQDLCRWTSDPLSSIVRAVALLPCARYEQRRYPGHTAGPSSSDHELASLINTLNMTSPEDLWYFLYRLTNGRTVGWGVPPRAAPQYNERLADNNSMEIRLRGRGSVDREMLPPQQEMRHALDAHSNLCSREAYASRFQSQRTSTITSNAPFKLQRCLSICASSLEHKQDAAAQRLKNL